MLLVVCVLRKMLYFLRSLIWAMGPSARSSVGKEVKFLLCLVWRLPSQLSVPPFAPSLPAHQGMVNASLLAGDTSHLPPCMFSFLSSSLRLADTRNLVTAGSLHSWSPSGWRLLLSLRGTQPLFTCYLERPRGGSVCSVDVLFRSSETQFL